MIVILVLVSYLGQEIFQEKFDFLGILNLETQKGSGPYLKCGSGSDQSTKIRI